MVISDGGNDIRGNTVLRPEYKPSKEYIDKEYRKLDKAKREALNRQRKLRLKKKMAVLRMIAFIFIVGIFVIYRYSTLFKMEASLTKAKNEVTSLRAQNDSLRIDLSEKNNINDIESYSLNNLHMKKPTAVNAIKVDLDKNNFKPVENKNNTSNNFFQKLKKMLF